MEVLFDFAPDATYYVTNDWSSHGDQRSAIDWMIANGVDVINASAGWGWTGPGDGTSRYSDSILRTVDAAVSGGAMWSNSAGNNYGNAWLGPFNDPDGDGYHNFHSDDECNDVDVRDDFGFAANLRWEDTWGGASRDLDLYLMDSSGNVVLDSNDFQVGEPFNNPHEALWFDPASEATYCLAIRQVSGARPGWIELVAWQEYEFEHFTEAGGLISPSESRNRGLLAVAAAPWNDTNTIAYYSSRGPTTDGRIKPDITGATNGSSVTYHYGYGGTSAASPHIAGLAALVKQRFPDYGPQKVAQYLKEHADPRGNVPNNTWGYGFAKLPSSGLVVECRSDCQTLLAAKNTLVGSGDAYLNWDAGISIFEWDGVIANADQRVTRMSLAEKGLSGEIPSELGSLSNLTLLRLNENQLSGNIPAALGRLSNLRELHLDDNRLSGEIPPELKALSNLTHLRLNGNQLRGEIPSDLNRLSSLVMLDLFNNQLSGSIPSELGDLSNLEWLRLFNNKLTGNIPPELGKLTKLRSLFLTGNNFAEDSCIPAVLRDVVANDLDNLGLPFCDGEATPTPTPTATPVTVQVPEEVLNRISRLETLVATLQGLIATLQSAITTLDSRVTALEEDASRPTPIPTPTPTSTPEPGAPTPTPAPTSTPIADACVETISGDGAISGDWIDNSPCTSKKREDDDQEGAYALYYTFTLNEDSDVKITLESEVDTYIYLLSGAGKDGAKLCENDDHHASDVDGEKCKSITDTLAEDTDAGLIASLDSGEYTIEATTWYAKKPGNFTLTVSGLQ